MKTHHRNITLLVLIGLVVTQSGAAQGIRLKPIPGTRGVATGTGATETGMTIGPSTTDATPPGNITARPEIVAVSLTWPAVPGASSYSVMRAPGADGRFVPVTATPIAGAEFTDNGLTPATNYYYKVSATRPDGHSGTSAPVHVRTLAGTNPTGLKGGAKDHDVTLTWDVVPGVTSYSVFVPGRSHATVTGTSYTANALPDGTHAFAVWSLHRSGNQDYAADELNPARVTVNVGLLRGRYRVTLTGFTVNHETSDNALQSDGKRDEVFISTDVKFLDASGGSGNEVLSMFDPGAISYVFGDTYGITQQNRRKAGNADSYGGLQTGDHYPEDPYSGVPIQGPGWIPLILWEGDLVQNQTAVIVTPTIWEYDGTENSAVLAGWLAWAQKTTQSLQQSKEFLQLVGPKATTGIAVSELALGAALSFTTDVLGKDGDRPIGGERQGQEYRFAPKSLSFNYQSLENFLSDGHRVAGYPRGVYPLTYRDTGEWGGGNYTIFVKVEKVK